MLTERNVERATAYIGNSKRGAIGVQALVHGSKFGSLGPERRGERL